MMIQIFFSHWCLYFLAAQLFSTSYCTRSDLISYYTFQFRLTFEEFIFIILRLMMVTTIFQSAGIIYGTDILDCSICSCLNILVCPNTNMSHSIWNVSVLVLPLTDLCYLFNLIFNSFFFFLTKISSSAFFIFSSSSL